ncbi:MAG: GumC family protein, partial [Methylocella sp.]
MTQVQDSHSILTLGFEKFDPYAFLTFLRRRLGVILGVAAIVCLVAGATLMLIRPLYKASSLILIDLNSAGTMDREASTGVAIDSGFVDSQIEVLQSPALARRAVEKLGLDKDPDFNRQKDGIFSFFGFLFRNGQAGSEASAMSPAVEKFIDALSIERHGFGYVISVGFTWPDPVKAAEYANALADAYLEDQIATRSEQMQRAMAMFNERIALLAVNVRNAEMAVEQFKIQNNLHVAQGATLNDQQLSEMTALLIKARADVAERAARYKQVQELLAKGGSAATIAEVLQSPVITNMKTQLSEVMRREARMTTRYASDHPIAGIDLADIVAERRSLEAQIKSEVDNVITNIKNELEVAKSRQTSLEDSLRTVSESRNVGEEASVQLRELERRAEASRVIYRNLLDQSNAAQENKIAGATKARIISRATVPIEPSFPKIVILMPLIAVLGLLFGVGWGYTLEKIDCAFYSAEDIEIKLRLPVLAALPQIGSQRKTERHILVSARLLKEDPCGAYAESLRTLRGALELSLGGVNRVVMVTSSVPSEGKSSIVLALATSLACAGRSVVVVELDLRKPGISEQLGMGGKPGVLEFMAGNDQDPQNYITYLSDRKVSLMVANGPVNDPPTILGSPKLARAVEALASRFDYVLLDTPPLAPVIDSRLIANMAAGLIFVVKWGD